MEIKIEHRLTAVEDMAKSNSLRLDDVEKRQDNLEKLTSTVEVLAVREKNVEADVKEIKTGIDLNPFLNGDTKTRLNIIKSAIAKQARQNLVGGMRYQSTSDFRYEYGSDYQIGRAHV